MLWPTERVVSARPTSIFGLSVLTRTKVLSLRVASARLVALTKVWPAATGLTLPEASTVAITGAADRQVKPDLYEAGWLAARRVWDSPPV